MVFAIERLPEPMRRLLRSLGVDPAAARRAGLGSQMAEMARVCGACSEAARCRRAIGSGPAGSGPAGSGPADSTPAVPAFCPNAGRFALADGYLHRWCIAE